MLFNPQGVVEIKSIEEVFFKGSNFFNGIFNYASREFSRAFSDRMRDDEVIHDLASVEFFVTKIKGVITVNSMNLTDNEIYSRLVKAGYEITKKDVKALDNNTTQEAIDKFVNKLSETKTVIKFVGIDRTLVIGLY